MTRDELIAAVPVYEYEGRPFYVNLGEIPQPWQAQFWAALYGSQCPKIDGVERAAYAWDWECWVHGSWYGRHGPTGLDSEPVNMHALHRLADYPVLAALASARRTATKLDGRACLHLYKDALGDIDWLALSSHERDFMRSLGLFSICPCCGVSGLVRDTRDYVVTGSDGQAATIKALTGDYCDACGEVLLNGAEGQRVMDALPPRVIE